MREECVVGQELLVEGVGLLCCLTLGGGIVG